MLKRKNDTQISAVYVNNDWSYRDKKSQFERYALSQKLESIWKK